MFTSQNLPWLALAAFAVWQLYPYATSLLKKAVPGSKEKYPKSIELLLAWDKLRSHCEEIGCKEGLDLTNQLAPHILKHKHSVDSKESSGRAAKSETKAG